MMIKFMFNETGTAVVVPCDKSLADYQSELRQNGDPDQAVVAVSFGPEDLEDSDDIDALMIIGSTHYLERRQGGTSALESLASAIFKAGVEYGRQDKFRWRPE